MAMGNGFGSSREAEKREGCCVFARDGAMLALRVFSPLPVPSSLSAVCRETHPWTPLSPCTPAVSVSSLFLLSLPSVFNTLF
ncbi:hypothetical protein D8674_005677 [Pyrus ussuriensis x Pyrus communis]|uniref:Uncharacterized protein n=1 Tax=Pyrus ussuriensis x Pyrus communis TaxID=2448454 RepID=A0A5N5FX49_9ROSA|nr:hypothetical protein D8674_005677 [Pyrus ussuriensis x Pyrus communis]